MAPWPSRSTSALARTRRSEFQPTNQPNKEWRPAALTAVALPWKAFWSGISNCNTDFHEGLLDYILGTVQASVEDFMMMKVIGKGSFGRVLLGKQIKTGTIYAIKVLSKEAIVKQVSIRTCIDRLRLWC